MRHFSGEFEGLQLLMLDELDAISGGDGEDTDDGSTPPTEPDPGPDIVVNGIRQDQMDRTEQLMEREWWITSYMVLGKFANAEIENGSWVIRGADAPTEDQKLFKSNYDKVHGLFWGTMTDSQQASLASSLNDAGVDLVGSNIDLGAAYSHYGTLLSSGAVQGSGTDDFAIWVHNGGR